MDERTEHYIRLIGLKIIPAYFYSRNPSVVSSWQFSMCRQTSIIIANILRTKGINCQAWEGNFQSAMVSKYDHSWNYIPETKTIIDVTSTFPYVIHGIDNDPVQALKGTLEIQSIGKYKEIDVIEALLVEEYYTRLTGIDILFEIFEIIKQSKINF